MPNLDIFWFSMVCELFKKSIKTAYKLSKNHGILEYFNVLNDFLSFITE